MTIIIIHWLIVKSYIYIYIFNIQNTLHIRSSTDPFSLIMHVKHGSKGYIRIVSLCYKLHVPFFFYLVFKAIIFQEKLVVDMNTVCMILHKIPEIL